LDTVRGLRCQPGLRYGHLIGTQVPHSPLLAELSAEDIATPYRAMIWIHNCVGPIEISDIELDGNLQHLSIGGEYGDVGRQIPATGLWLLANSNKEIV